MIDDGGVLFAQPAPRYVIDFGNDYPTDDDGIPTDNAWWASSPATMQKVADLDPERSLALLGEPGIGKSNTIDELVRDDPAANHVQLDEAHDVRALENLLAPTVHAAPAVGRHTLVLDGLDECPLAPKTLIRRVVAAVAGRTNVRVVVGCRTADWPTEMGDQLRSALGSFNVLELLPLSAEDIQALADSRGVDGRRFLTAVRSAGAGPLATLPLTLDLLLSLYEQQGGLPAVPRDLYERGLMILAGEPDPNRAVERGTAGSDAQRLAIAARIAAALLLCGGTAVAVRGQPGQNDLPFGGLAAGTERLPAGDFAVTTELVHQTLATALFSGRGPDKLGIRHASFSAYLTAHYLHAHQIPEHQLRALLTRTSSLGGTSVPTRLRETAAWLVALDPQAHRWLVDVDPDTIIAHSVLVADPHVRVALVSRLLDQQDVDRGSRRRWRFAHPGLADQLRPALRAPIQEEAGPHFGHPVSRRAYTAMEIARRSGTLDVASDIAALVASPKLNPYLRSAAAHALADLDSELAASVLTGVLDEVLQHPDRDPHDDLRGVALATCWPAALSVPKLLSALTGPQDRNYIGSYQTFLHNFVDELTDEAVEEVLRAVAGPGLAQKGSVRSSAWCDEDETDPSESLLTGTRRGAQLMTDLLERVLANPRLEEFVAEAGWLIADCIRQNRTCTMPLRFTRKATDNEDADLLGLRRALVLAALPHLDAASVTQLVWRWTWPSRFPEPSDPVPARLLDGDDLDWVFTLADGPSAEHAPALIRTIYDPADRRHQDIAWAHRDHPVFSASIGHWFEPVEIGSPLAARMRQEHQWSAPEPNWEGAQSHPSAIAEAWSRCKNGDALAFADLCLRLRTDPNTGYAVLDDDLAEWPSRSLLNADPDELATAARDYVTAFDVPAGDWLERVGSTPYWVLNAYAALSLLTRRADAKEWLDELADEVWEHWAPAIVRCPISGAGASGRVRGRLLEQLARRVPNALVEVYLRWTEQCLAAGWSLPALEPLASVYESGLGDRLSALMSRLFEQIQVISRELLTPPRDTADLAGARDALNNRLSVARQGALELAEFLSARGHAPTIRVLDAVVTGTAGFPGTAPPQARAIAAVALLAVGRAASTVFTLMQSDEEFGRALVHDLAQVPDKMQPLRRLDEAQLGEFWAWLAARWSPATDTFTSGFISEDDHVRRLRDRVLRELAARETPAALTTLAALASGDAGNPQVRALLEEAEIRERDESWTGPTLEQLMAMVADARRTLVFDDDGLYQLVLLVLERFAARLQTIGQLLWNETRRGDGDEGWVWRPKYEPDVSALLKDHFEQEFADRLVVNREVLVRQTTSRGHGLSVDVLASGGSSDGSAERPVNCPIEVKGSWNRDLLTALESQLVGDYLPALGGSRGVYLCAWFPVDDWTDDGDSRRATAATRDRDSVSRLLDEAAERASKSTGVRVAAVVVDVPRPTPSARTQPQASQEN